MKMIEQKDLINASPAAIFDYVKAGVITQKMFVQWVTDVKAESYDNGREDGIDDAYQI